MLKYQGFGGVDGVVAGSKHIFTLKNSAMEKILHDCGSDMQEEIGIGKKLLFPANDISSVVLSHGHFDHVGLLPELHMDGYRRNYFAQEATKDIVLMQLEETVSQEFRRINEFNNSIRGKKDSQGKFIPFRKQLFTNYDARQIGERFQGVKYGITFHVSDNVKATFYEAGHIIGSAQVLYEFNDNGRKIKILTCVDLGRSDVDCPIVKFPHKDFPDNIDYCFIESTYGNRKHADKEQSRKELEETLLKGIKDKKRILAGAFSIMRTHAILSDLYWIYKRGNLPRDFRIYLDSPSALRFNSVILKHHECMDEQARIDFRERRENPFNFPNLEIVRDRKLSFDLDRKSGPYMIISASGMWFMGRVVRHLQSHIEDPNALLVQTGYQIPGKIGAFLEEGKEKNPVINIEGKEYQYRAQQIRLHSYGAHADGDDCLHHVSVNVKPRKKVFIVHGEKEQQDWMLQKFKARGISSEIVRLGKEYIL